MNQLVVLSVIISATSDVNIKKMIIDGASATMINEVAITDGMISLEQDWLIKALNGRTSLEEVYAAAKENE